MPAGYAAAHADADGPANFDDPLSIGVTNAHTCDMSSAGPEPKRGPSRRAVLIGAGAVALAGAGTGAAFALRPPAATEQPAEAAETAGRLATRLLDTPGFTVAHHGGSRDWPEESLYAYKRSVSAGINALEVSLARSSDGVWFGLHDTTLDRTSGTFHIEAADYTWAEINALRIKPPSTGTPGQATRPYARFESILDAHAATHTLFVDPKAADPSRFGEVFAIIEKRVSAPTESIIAKGYCTSIPWATESRSRGYRGWGFYYANEIAAEPSLLADTQDYWSVLGLDYGGASGQWAAVRSMGKPVIAHVVPSLEAARAALALGADGLMLSGVAETVPHLTAGGAQ